MITGLILMAAAIACLLYALGAYRQRGPLLSTAYLIASPAQREKMKTKSEYYFIATTFVLLAAVLTVFGSSMVLTAPWLRPAGFVIIGILLLFVIVGSVRSETRKKG